MSRKDKKALRKALLSLITNHNNLKICLTMLFAFTLLALGYVLYACIVVCSMWIVNVVINIIRKQLPNLS